MEKNDEDAVIKALGEPIFSEFSDSTLKIRKNLLAFSIISMVVILGEIEIDTNSTLLGLKFNGLDNQLIIYILFFTTLYLFFHFFWCSLDSFFEWRIRVTGTKLAHVTTAILSSEHGDYPNDPRQSTLYSWWLSEAKKIGSFKEYFTSIEDKLNLWEKNLIEATSKHNNSINISNACSTITQILDPIQRLKKAIDETVKVVNSKRIPVSLERFDDCFKLLSRSQNLRWLVIELLFPIVFGISALLLLIGQICSS